jgi:hypothetical protein
MHQALWENDEINFIRFTVINESSPLAALILDSLLTGVSETSGQPITLAAKDGSPSGVELRVICYTRSVAKLLQYEQKTSLQLSALYRTCL